MNQNLLYENESVESTLESTSDIQLVKEIGEAYNKMRHEIHKIIVGQEEVVDNLLTSIFAGGHVLLVGVPGLAKTLLVTSLCQALHLEFKRIQFTPDLMPSDIVGTEVIQDDPVTKERMFKFMAGPIFSNIILADEINRTPPKTQAALLEAMQEKQVSIGGKVYPLAKPFFVIATQNPIDQEGTYPLPEAQQDRFLFNLFVDYPEDEDEMEIVRTVTSGTSESIIPVVTGEDILRYQDLIKKAPVADHVVRYAVDLVRATRREKPEATDFVKQWLSFGAGPRASLALISAAKARAILNGNYHVSADDVAAVAIPVLRHRIAPNFGAFAEGINSVKVIEHLLETIPQNGE
jgi:MoxR-like ATPase